MHKYTGRYKQLFLTIFLLLSNSYGHLALTLPHYGNQIINFDAFPSLFLHHTIQFLHALLPALSDWGLFFLVEIFFSSLLFLSLYRLLQIEFDKREAKLLSWLFFLLLPLIFLINYRLSLSGVATVFYPSDFVSLFAICFGLLCCLKQQWLLFTLCIFLATFNRVSSLLLVFLIPCFHWQRKWFRPFLAALLAWLAAMALWLNSPSQTLLYSFHFNLLEQVKQNFLWLFSDSNLMFFNFAFAGLPLFWFTFYDFIPLTYRPLRYLGFTYFICLLMIGSFAEVRLFHELVMLIYLPICVALVRWINDLSPLITNAPKTVLYYLNRYFILTSLVGGIILHIFLNAR